MRLSIRRQASSRVSVIISASIVGIFVALTISVIIHLRERAKLAASQNNLRMIALAVHNFNSSHNRLPPLVETTEWKHPISQSMFALLNPFLESTPIIYRTGWSADRYHGHSSVKFQISDRMGSTFTQSGGMVNQIYRVFLDPADDTGNNLIDVPMVTPDGTTGNYAAGSYAGNGMAPWSRPFGSSFPRGTSATILFGQRPQVCTESGRSVYNLWGLGFYSPHMPLFATLTPSQPEGLISTEMIAPILPLPNAPAPIQYRTGTSQSPKHVGSSSPLQRVGSGRPCDPRLPGGVHRSGMPAAMADGSVRMFAYDVSPRVFWNACDPELPIDN